LKQWVGPADGQRQWQSSLLHAHLLLCF
jgi:hypothetical protein